MSKRFLRKVFCRASHSSRLSRKAFVEAVESRLLFSGLLEHRGVNDFGVYGPTTNLYGSNGGNMASWGVDITRQDIPFFDQTPMDSTSVPAPTGGTLHGLQSVKDDLTSSTHLGSSAITIFCPFNWNNQELVGMVPSSQSFWSGYKTRLNAMATQFAGDANVWLEVWNEPYAYTDPSPSTYVADMEAMISSIRTNTGFTGKIVIPGAENGGDETEILANGQALVNFDPQHNLVFDLHAYNTFMDGKTSAQIEARIQKILDTGVELIFGEYGPKDQGNPNHLDDVGPFLTAVKNKHVTALAWHWQDKDVNTLHNADETLNNTAANYNWANQVKAYTQGARSTLPSGWTDTDIGGPLAGSAGLVSGIWTVKGSGADIEGTSDQFNFAQQDLSGNGTVIANVRSVQNTNTYAKAGVMIRGGTAANAPFAAVFVTPGKGALFQVRTAAGVATTASPWLTTATAPQYVKLVRSGNTFTAYVSSDGSTYTQIGSPTTISMPTLANAGLAVTSHDASLVCTATFDYVSIKTNVPVGSGLPAGWTNTNIGSPAVTGTTTNTSPAAYTVTGGGDNITGYSDQFNFASAGTSGDKTLIARITSFSNTSTNAQAGVMFRDSNDPSSLFAMVNVTPTGVVQFDSRNTAGGTAGVSNSATTGITPSLSTPIWVRLVKSGSNFTAYYGTGTVRPTSWIQVGTNQTIAFTQSVYRAGLAVCSWSTTLQTTAVIDNVDLA